MKFFGIGDVNVISRKKGTKQPLYTTIVCTSVF